MAVMVWAVRPWLGRLFEDASGPLSRGRTAHVLIVLLASALLTEVIGIHALFGAFLAGAIMPPSRELRRQLRERLESLSSVFLLPIFFRLHRTADRDRPAERRGELGGVRGASS